MRNITETFLFPSCLITFDNSLIVTEKLLLLSKELLKKHNHKPFNSNCVSTIHNFSKVLEMDEFAEVKKEILRAVKFYSQKIDIDLDNLEITESWLNHYNIGDYQDLHLHHNSLLSGVFYLQTQPDNDLIFQAPWYLFQYKLGNILNNNVNNQTQVKLVSRPGRGYLFPSYLMHQTTPSKSDRISLSFNLNYIRKKITANN